MATSQSLFRRHRNRGRDENDNDSAPPTTSSGDNVVDDGGVNNESSPAVGASSSSEMRNNIGSNAYDAASSNLAIMTSSHDSLNDTLTPLEDGEQELIVQVPTTGNPNNSDTRTPFVLPTVAWEPTEEATALRRGAIRRDVERVQRANFVHFLILCLVPTALLLIVIATILSEDGECSAGGNDFVCEREPRNFVNAFTSRCICDAVKISMATVGEDLDWQEGG